jgi:hypothetical protein
MNPKQRSLFLGGIAGAAIGALAGYLYTRGIDQSPEEAEAAERSLKSMPPTEMIKLAIAVVGVLRIVAELGERG